jgi:predicted DNA-binding transcriptional regulator YafY
VNSRYGRRIDEIARHLECSERTVRRYLECLQQSGYPIYSSKSARGTVWKLEETFRNIPPIPFNALDAMAIVIARKALISRNERFCAEQLGNLLQRLSQGRLPEFQRKLNEIEQSVFALASLCDITSHLTLAYGSITEAIAEHRKLRISYRNASGKLSSNRVIAPLHIWIVEQQSYLIAYCYKNAAIRTFCIQRFQKTQMLTDKFENTWSFDLKKHAGESFGAFHNQPENIELVFDSMLETYLHDHPLHTGQRLRRRDGLLLMRLKVGINESLINRLLGFGTMVRVLQPSRLASIIATRHRKAAEMYEDEPHNPATPGTESTLPLEFE